MKIKVAAVLTCIALGLALTGCGTTHFDPSFPNINDTTIGGTVDIPDGTGEAPDMPEEPEPGEEPETGKDNEPPKDNETTPPANAQAVDTVLRCTASSLNVRKGAGSSYAVVGTLDKGDMVMPVRKSGDWYEILYLGGSAYASASYLTEVSFDKASDKIESVITEGKKLLGIPYVYGAQRYHFGNGSLNTKFDGKSYDCSSLMQYIFKVGANVNLAMTSREQSLQGREIARGDIRRGDLLFFTNASRLNKTGLERIGHVALYLGDNIILHTASDHAVIEPISAVRSSYYITARRLID